MNESSQISKMLRHRAAPVALRAFVGAALLAFVFSRGADLRHVLEIMSDADWRILLVALAIATAGEALTAWKWTMLVRYAGGALPYGMALRASFIGMFYNNFLPGSVGGDIVRVLLIAREAGGKARAAASVFMQRNTGLAGLFAIGIPAAFLWPRLIDWPGEILNRPLTNWLHDCLSWLLAAFMGYGMVNVLLFSRTAYHAVWHFLHKHVHWRGLKFFTEKLRRFHTELHEFRFWLAGPLAISAATQLVDIFMVWTLAHALGLSVSSEVLLVAVPMVTLANLLPITINGIGLREMMYVGLLTSAGVTSSQAVALSLMQFGVVITLSSAGGILQATSTPKASA